MICVLVVRTLIAKDFYKIESPIMPDVLTDKDKQSNGESLAYKERVEVNKREKEWFQLFGARSFQTQRTLSSLSSGKFNLLLSVLLCLHNCISCLPYSWLF